MEGSGQIRQQKESRKEMFEKLNCVAGTKTREELVMTYKGLQYPSLLCNLATFQELECTFQPRPDDALLIAYPKCGFNWAIQLLKSMAILVNKDMEKYIESYMPILEFGQPEKFKLMDKCPAPRVYGTHFYYDDLPKSFFVNNTKMLVVFRNPKDTAVSFFHFYNKNPMLPSFDSWDEFFPRYMTGEVLWGSYFEHAVAWNKHMEDPTVLLMTFEEMKEDLTAAVKKIAAFFDFSLNEEQIQVVVKSGNFNEMREKYKETNAAFGEIFLRKGEVGDWKNLFSEAQSKEMDAKFEECLAGTALGKKLNYNLYCKY